jgi:glycosyltransferase involved in cell wall biosynthesis
VMLLDILVPTYRRPKSFMALIDSVLECHDTRFKVIANSNGYEPLLEDLRFRDPRLDYSHFSENKGGGANTLFLLKRSKARFCMLLSDEDRINPDGLVKMLDMIDSLPTDIAVFNCALYPFPFDSPPSLRKSYYQRRCFYLQDVIAFSLLPPFMSGLVYRRDLLDNMNLAQLLSPSAGNAYGHMDIAISALALSGGRHFFYREKVILEGDQVCQGGDAYAHRLNRVEKVNPQNQNLDLNPDVYGPYARVMQFFHKEKFHEELYLAGKISLLTKIRAKFKLVGRQVIVVLTSNKVVVLPDGITVLQEAERGFTDAKENGLVTGTISAKTFMHLLKTPASIRKFMFSLMSLLFGPIKIYQIIKIILLRRCSYW